MHRRENFTAYEIMPEDLAIYMSHNGPHFNSRCCQFAVENMYKTDANGNETPIKEMKKDEVDRLLASYNIDVKNAKLYDTVYVANMIMADYYGISILTKELLAKHIKATLDDPDGMEGLVFNRWIADMKWLGIPIPWEEFI